MAMIDLGDVTRFAAGAVGEPGKRTFFVEVAGPAGDHWFQAEKSQVAALALEAATLLRTAGLEGSGTELDAVMRPPADVAFRVGDIGIVYTEESGTFTMVLMPLDEAEDEEVRFTVTAPQLDAMAREAATVVTSGRPACPRCGLAMDPEGHVCPASNGDLRHHRP
jgi:uncharacterized repeat protein (TIGR03847 family)